MNKQIFITTGKFAALSRTTRSTLHLYDKLGLVQPTARGENKYRYYSLSQISTVNVIHILQKLGMSLNEIKTIKDNRTPESMYKLLKSQIFTIDGKIAEWLSAKKLLQTYLDTIQSVYDIEEEKITIQFLPETPIVVGKINDYSRGKNDYYALKDFYDAIHESDPSLDLNYPVWGKYTADRIKSKDWVWPDRYYFHNPEGRDKRPAALYAIGYTRGGYGETDKLYQNMMEYIEKNGFEVCGDAYEEYPLNELCILNDNDYLLRLMITVRKKAIKSRASPSVFS